MRLTVALVAGALALCVSGLCLVACARPLTTSTTSAPVSSGLASRGPISSESSSSEAEVSEGGASEAVSTGGVWSQGAVEPTMTAPAASISVDPALEKRLWALADSGAKSEGGTVKKAQAVPSTHVHAVQVTMGDGVQDDESVWVVQVEGVADFVCDACSVPPGASAPRGRFQLYIVDASTFRTLDFGLTNTDADLAQLGPVLDLHP